MSASGSVHRHGNTSTESAGDGVTMIDAVQEKYLNDNGLHENSFFVEIYVPRSSAGKNGSAGQSVPTLLTLDYQNISQAGPADNIQELCSHVTELDVTSNAFKDWAQVFTILDNLPELKFLNLTSNPLAELTPDGTARSYNNLRSLVLNKTSASWTTVQQLLDTMACLVELHLSLNDYTSVELATTHDNLQTLHINTSLITDWREVIKLGQAFPKLSKLVIIETNLSRFDSSAEEIQQAFPALKDLNISEMSIDSWEELEKLNHFPSLTFVRLQGIPLLADMNEKVRRGRVIASLWKITKLNGSPVTDTEREDAERGYIRHYMSASSKPKRFFELEEKYGQLDPLAEVCLKPKTEVLLNVSYNETRQNVRVNVKHTVTQLRKQLAKLIEQPLPRLRFYYTNVGGPVKEVELKYPSKLLYSLNMKDGDEILILDKPYY